MDIHLGTGIDGIDAADRIRTDFDIPVIFLTAHSDHATLERAKRSKPFGYVLKPFGDKDLQTAIEMAVYRHRVDRQIRDDNHWLAATLGSIGDAVIATDINGNVQFMNSLAEQLTAGHWKKPLASTWERCSVFKPPAPMHKSQTPFTSLWKRSPSWGFPPMLNWYRAMEHGCQLMTSHRRSVI